MLLEMFLGRGDKLNCCKLVPEKHCPSIVCTDKDRNDETNSPTVLESRDDGTNESAL